MKNNIVNLLLSAGASALILLCGVGIARELGKKQTESMAVRMHASPAVTAAVANESSRSVRVAERLARRLAARQMSVPSTPALASAVAKHEMMMKRTVTVVLKSETPGIASHSGTLLLDPHHTWVQLKTGMFSASFVVDAAAVQRSLENGEVPALTLRQNMHVGSAKADSRNIQRAESTGKGKAGYVIDTKAAAEQIAKAFMSGQSVVTLPATYGEPQVTMTGADGQTKTLTLLGTGLSDFADSTPGREWNVHKAIEEKLNGVVIPAGGTFSLVPTLDAPITLEKGWKEALGLFGGGAAPTPGGGICQSATTLYRAALLAGLPIVEKRNHSLFVDHYEFYGVGLDATFFPGFHDLRFTNDTGEDIYMHAYTEGVTVYVQLYGHDDGRRVRLDGPYFAGTKNRNAALRPLSNHQIGWVRTVTKADGTISDEPIYATYAKPLFRYLNKYAGAGMKLTTQREI